MLGLFANYHAEVIQGTGMLIHLLILRTLLIEF